MAALRRHVLPGRGRRPGLPVAGRAPGRPRPAHVGPRAHLGSLLRRGSDRPAALRSPGRSRPGPHPVAPRRGPQPREPRLVRLRHTAVGVRCRSRPVGARRGDVPAGGTGQLGARRSGSHRTAPGSLRRDRDRWLHLRPGPGDRHLPGPRPPGAVPARHRCAGRRPGGAGPGGDPGDPDRSRTRAPRGVAPTGPAGRSVPPPAPPRRRGGRALPARHLPPGGHLRRPLGPLPHGPGRLDAAHRVGPQPLRGALRARRTLGWAHRRPPRTGAFHDHRDARRRADHRHLRPPRGTARHHRVRSGRGRRDGIRRAGRADGHGAAPALANG